MWCHLFWFQTCRLLCHISGTEPLEITCIHAEETFRVIGPQVNKREVVCYKSRNLASQLDMLFGKAFRDLHYIDFVNKNTEYCYSPFFVIHAYFSKINNAYLTHFVLCCWLCGSDYRKTAEANTLRHAGKKITKIAKMAWKLQLKCIFSAQSWMEIIFAVQVSLFNTNIKKDTNIPWKGKG